MIIFARQYQRTDATIDPSDNSGNIFLTKMFTETPSLIDYIDKARTGREYDFKVTNGTPKPIENINKYRGMPVSIPERILRYIHRHEILEILQRDLHLTHTNLIPVEELI
ncbi:MAG: hypothetical protein IJ342_07090 [Muribaculaceae bacterium]|nr:hypothetical protein [Muribaculaceae bacterium]